MPIEYQRRSVYQSPGALDKLTDAMAIMGIFQFSSRQFRFLGAVHDIIMSAIALYLAYASALGLSRVFAVPYLEWKIAAFLILSSAIFYYFSLNRGSWRYASLPDLFAIIKASVVLAVIFTLGMFLIERAENLPRSVPPMLSLLLIVLLGAPRLLYRIQRESSLMALLRGQTFDLRSGRRNVLVLGVNEAAEQFIRSTRVMKNADTQVAGILEDRPEKAREQIQGIKVVGRLDELPHVLGKLENRRITIDEIVVAQTDLGPSELAEIIERATANNLVVSRLPEIGARHDLAGGLPFERKPIRLTDLLNRKEIRIDNAGLAELIANRTVLITGAGGSIGSEISRQIASFRPSHLILSDHSEFLLYKVEMEITNANPGLPVTSVILDVRDEGHVEKVFSATRPNAVFHAAAMKHVPIVENNAIEGIKTNVLGTRNVADAAVRHGVSAFVMISTDKAVNPTNVMGATKRAAEAYCQSLDLGPEPTRFKTVRFGNVLGSSGSVVPLFQKQIEAGGPVTVTHPDIVRYFMSIPEAVRLVLQASSHGLSAPEVRGKILVLDMGEPVKIAELARKMIYLAGLRPDIDIEVKYIGLRPGEKLFEELFSDSEAISEKGEDGYMIASPRPIDMTMLSSALAGLKDACAAENDKLALEMLRHIVPEYRPAQEKSPTRMS